MTIDHDRLTKDGAANFAILMHESREKIEEAWAGALAEAQLQETSPKLKVGFGIVIDTEEHKVEYFLTFAVRHKRSIEAELPNPAQPELPITDDPPGIKRKRASAK